MRKEEVLILRSQIMKAAQQKEPGKNTVKERIMGFLLPFPIPGNIEVIPVLFCDNQPVPQGNGMVENGFWTRFCSCDAGAVVVSLLARRQGKSLTLLTKAFLFKACSDRRVHFLKLSLGFFNSPLYPPWRF